MANNLGWHSLGTTVYAFEFYFIPRLSITRRPFLKKNLMRDEGIQTVPENPCGTVLSSLAFASYNSVQKYRNQ